MDKTNGMSSYYGAQFSDLTVDNFRRWNKLNLFSDMEPCYCVYHDKLLKKSDEFEKNNDEAMAQMSLFIAHISSMYLTNKADCPLDAFWKSPEGRSFSLDDLAPDNLDFFESIIPECDNILIKGRLADILWIMRKKIEMAWIAIENYIKMPIQYATWYYRNDRIWQRAVILVNQLGRAQKAIQYRDQIRKVFLELLLSEAFSEESLIIEYAKILFQLFLSDIDREKVKQKLRDYAEYLMSHGNNFKARTTFFQILKFIETDCYEERNPIFVRIAESFVSDADKAPADSLITGESYKNAIKYYRNIPVQFRSQWNIDERIKKLYDKMRTSNTSALFHMQKMATEGIDCTEAIGQSENMISGKDFIPALGNLCLVSPSFSYQDERKKTLDYIKDFPIIATVSSKVFDNSGRVVGQYSGIDLSDPESEKSFPAFWALMIRRYGFSVNCVVQIAVLPALNVFNCEHHITEDDLISLCQGSSIISTDRVHLWAKGLYFGFNDDFITAVHLLCPQIEHMVRMHLQYLGEKTTVLEDSGVEIESGLSNLIKNARIGDVLSEDALFEIRALLTEHSGPNLRNQVAHGLLDDKYIHSPFPVYLWWFCLKLVCFSNPDFLEKYKALSKARGPEEP